jgi:membrane-associated phospholipid phosphatase
MLGRLRRKRHSRRAIWRARAVGPASWAGTADQAVLRFLRTRGHDPITEGVMRALGLAGEYGAVWMAIGSTAAALDRRRRSRWLAGALVAPTAIVVNFAVKRTVGRERPVITEHPPLARAPSKLSFPSAHATSSVAAATALGRVRPGGRAPLYALATAICVGRPYLGMHYPSDVLAGAALGAAIGFLAPLPTEPPPPISDHPSGFDRGSEAGPPSTDHPTGSHCGSEAGPPSADHPPGIDRGSESASRSDSSQTSGSREAGRN